MPVRRGHVAPQNTFIDTIIRKFDGQSKYNSITILNLSSLAPGRLGRDNKGRRQERGRRGSTSTDRGRIVILPTRGAVQHSTDHGPCQAPVNTLHSPPPNSLENNTHPPRVKAPYIDMELFNYWCIAGRVGIVARTRGRSMGVRQPLNC